MMINPFINFLYFDFQFFQFNFFWFASFFVVGKKLPVGTFTYTSDQRFQAIHRENSDDWSLQISYPRKKDAGIYECQVKRKYILYDYIILFFFDNKSLYPVSD